MNSTNTTTEMLEEIYRRLPEDLAEPEAVTSDDKSEVLNTLISELESLIEEREKASNGNSDIATVTTNVTSTEKTENNLSSVTNEEKVRNSKSKQVKKSLTKTLFAQLRSADSNYSESLWMRVMRLCIKNKRVTELLHILTEKENNNYIVTLFTRISPTLLHDYEDCLFILADYLSKTSPKLDVLYTLLKFSVENEIFSLYPVFSLSLRKMLKTFSFNESKTFLNYMMFYKMEISTCVINYVIESLCRNDKIEEAQEIFTKFLNYESKFNLPSELSKESNFTKLVTQSGVNITTYGTFIKCLCKSNHMELALYYYESLKEKNLIKDEIIFNLLIDGCSKTSNLDQLRNIYFDMLSLNITPTIVTFNTIIDAYIRARDINSAWKIYDDILTKGIKPDNFTYSTLFRGIRHKSHKEYLHRSFAILEELRSELQNGRQIDIILINVLLDSCISMRDEKLIVDIFEKVSMGYYSGIKPDIITFNTFIKGCAQMNLFEKAYEAFDSMFKHEVTHEKTTSVIFENGTIQTLNTSDKSKVTPNDVFFNTMIDVCVRSNNMPRVWGIIEKMKEVGIKPDNFTYSTIIKGLNKNTNLNNAKMSSKDGSEAGTGEASSTSNNNTTDLSPINLNFESPSELDLAFKLFENVKKFSRPDEILYNCIMDACLRFDRIDRMLEIYEEMLLDKVRPSSITCGIIIKAYGMKGYLLKALDIYEDMKRGGIKISSITYGCLINACIKNDNLPKAFELYEELAKNNIEMNIVLYTTLIKAYSKNKELHKVLEIFNQMKNDKYNSPNNVTYNSVIDCCVKNEEMKLAENIFKEMLNSGVKPDIITFSTLIKGCLRKGDLAQAVQNVVNMKKYEVKPDEVLLNSLLDGCEKLKKFSKAVEIFSYVRGFGVEPSMMSFSIMMKVYGKLNDFSSSKSLIEEVKKKNKNISLIIFTCYMKTCFDTHNTEEGLLTYNNLRHFRLTPDSITYATVLNGLAGHSKNKGKEMISIIKESLNLNIMLNYKVYSDVVKKISSEKDMAKEAEEITALLESHDIHLKGGYSYNLGRTTQTQSKKNDNNMNYLINSYKPKAFTHEKRKEKFETQVNNNKSDNKAMPLQNKDFSKKLSLANLSTGVNYSLSQSSKVAIDKKDENYSFFDKGINSTTNVKITEETEKRPVFINSKRENGVKTNSTTSTPVYALYNNLSSSSNTTGVNEKETKDQIGKMKKFNRF